MFDLTNVTKLYGRVVGVNDITLSLGPGAYGLLGPNGSGKSTLLNILIGQLRPTLGTVRVFGESPRNNSSLRRRLGYCPSNEGLYADVSAFEWVRYLQQLGGMSKKDATRVAMESLERCGLHEAMNRPISTYSRGMRQRVKLAQAIAHEPDLLILDEPFSGLDPLGRIEMTKLLKQWIGEGKSLLLASHVLHEIESVTQSFLLISGGRLLASGTASEVHSLLAGVPNEIMLRCSEPRRLADVLLRAELGHAFRMEVDSLHVSTKNPGRLYEELPERMQEADVSVTEIHSADESLQSLFNSLMRIHRGEL